MKISLGFSPCPNDTFIFDALVNHKTDSGDLEWEVFIEDVQTLNEWALEGRLLVSKISYGVLPLVLNNYLVLHSGGALGKGTGPLLIARHPIPEEKIPECSIAIPGINTTAHQLFSLAYPTAKNKQYMIFSSIEEAILSGKADCGVIIHENRFTYQQKGLVKLKDLGEYWENNTNSPIPLGGIIARRTLDPVLLSEINQLIRKSTEYALSRLPEIPDYVKDHAREMEESVMRQHIELYVNAFSVDMGLSGKKAVEKLLAVGGYHSRGSEIFAED